MLGGVLLYGLFGYAVEYGFTALARRAKAPSVWMVPIYGLAALAFPPIRAVVRGRSATTRAVVYAAATIAAEYMIGRALRTGLGAAPWSYDSRFAIDGVTRLDYAPLWGLYGLALEWLEDAIKPVAS